MKIYPELKKIAGANEKVRNLAKSVKEKMDIDGLDFSGAYLVNGCKETKNHLYCGDCRMDNCGLVDDLYYCDQYTGWCEDDFYGTLYFKTNVPGQFVAIPFAM